LRSIPQYCSFVVVAGIVALMLNKWSESLVIHAGPLKLIGPEIARYQD